MTGMERMSGENSELNCFTEGANGKVLFLDHNICDFTYSHEVYLVMLTRTCGMGALGWRCWDSLLDKGTVLFGRHHVLKHRWYLEHKKNRDFHAGRRGASCSSMAEVWQMCSEHCSASRSRR